MRYRNPTFAQSIKLVALFFAVFSGFTACKIGSKDLQLDPELKRSIFPIADGWTWTYNLITFGNSTFGVPCQPGTRTQSMSATATIQGKTAVWLPLLCASTPTNAAYSVTGDQVWKWTGTEWISYLDAPLTEGRSFISGTRAYTWYRPYNVTVPAGTFNDCWTKKDNRSDSFETFCRGVGLVISHNADAAPNGWRATLERTFGPTVRQSGDENDGFDELP